MGSKGARSSTCFQPLPIRSSRLLNRLPTYQPASGQRLFAPRSIGRRQTLKTPASEANLRCCNDTSWPPSKSRAPLSTSGHLNVPDLGLFDSCQCQTLRLLSSGEPTMGGSYSRNLTKICAQKPDAGHPSRVYHLTKSRPCCATYRFPTIYQGSCKGTSQ